MLSLEEKTRLEHFKAAKAIAFRMNKGEMLRATYQDQVTNYSGLRGLDGRTWVVAESEADLPNPDAWLQLGNEKRPMREVSEAGILIRK